MNITATSEATAQEVIKVVTYYNSRHTVWYAVRLVCWIGNDGNNHKILYYKWQKGDNGYHAWRLNESDFKVSYGGVTSTVNFTLGYSTTGWTNCCSTQQMAVSVDSGTIQASGMKFVSTGYDTVGTFNVSENITIGEISGSDNTGTEHEEPYIPVTRIDGLLSRYLIYVDGAIIYTPYLGHEQIIDPELNEEINQIATLKFKIPYDNPSYSNGLFTKYKTNIEVKEGGESIFRGRVTRITRGFDMCINIESQNVMSYLGDTEYAPFEFKGEAVELFKRVINSHNGQVRNNSHKLMFRSTPYDAKYRVELKEEKYSNSMDIISSILDESDAYIDIYYDSNGTNYISLVTNFARNSTQQLFYGKNILSIEIDDSDADDYCNAVRATSGDLTTEIIENTDAIDFAGDRILKNISFSDIDDINELRKQARDYLNKHSVIKRTIGVTAVDLNLIDPNIQKFRLGDMAEVYMPALQISGWYLIRKRKIVINDPGENEYELGDATFGITDNVSIVKRRRWSRGTIKNIL